MTGDMTADPTLTDVMAALQDIGHAVSTDQLDHYQAALAHARRIGVTEEQIRDAYDYRSSQRVQAGDGVPSFTPDGEPRE